MSDSHVKNLQKPELADIGQIASWFADSLKELVQKAFYVLV